MINWIFGVTIEADIAELALWSFSIMTTLVAVAARYIARLQVEDGVEIALVGMVIALAP